MAALFRTLFTLVAGAGLAAGGFVAATMFPDVREQFAGENAAAATGVDSPFESEFAIPSNADANGLAGGFGAFQTDSFETGRELSGPAENFETSADDFLSRTDRTPAESAGFLPNAPAILTPSHGSSQTGSSQTGAPQSGGLPSRLQPNTPAAPTQQQSLWQAATAELKTAGIDDYTLRPTGEPQMLRCDCWVMDGAVRRQLSGFGASPATAINALTARVREFKTNSSWFSTNNPSPPTGSDEWAR